MKQKLYITRKIPFHIIKRLEAHCEVSYWDHEDIPVPRSVLEDKIKDIDGLYCLLTETIDADLLDRAPKLKVISNMAVGYNNIDVETATERHIYVTNTPDVLTETTADLTFSLLMATARRIPQASEFLRRGAWRTWSPMLLTGQDIHHSTLGIIGMGRIGEAVARRAKGFNMTILYHNRSRKFDTESDLGISYASLDDLLKASDFVCVLTPLTAQTYYLLGSEQFKMMKETAILINSSRGGVVNEEELYVALKKGELWAAGLDVFEKEPVSLHHPLLTLPNVVTLPHIGSASISTRMAMAELAAHNILAAFRGELPPHSVNMT